jgi:hypothetical protein
MSSFFGHHTVALLASTKKIFHCTVYCISLKAVSSALVEIILEKYDRNTEKHQVLLN